jgi:cell division protein YceG involved in septum cleavage
MALRPVSSDEAQRVNVAIISGSSPSQIGELLQEKKVIRSKTAFAIYTRIHNVRNKLQAGSFSLSPADSTSQIVDSLTSGEAEQFDITFYPGATLNIASTSVDKSCKSLVIRMMKLPKRSMLRMSLTIHYYSRASQSRRI